MSAGELFSAPATGADLQEIAELVNSAYRGDSSRAGWTTEADLFDGQRTDPEMLARELGRNPGRTILCLRGKRAKEILGCVFLERFSDSSGVGCYLGMLTVKPTLQDQGLGRALLERAEDQARAWGATRITLGVIFLRDTLMAWYERRGYHRTGETRPFPYEEAVLDLPKRKDLYFVMFEKKIG